MTSSANFQTPATSTTISRVFIALLIVSLLGALDTTIVATALPTVVADLGGLRYMALILTAYTVGTTVSLPILGRLGDMMSRPRLLLISIIVFLVGSLLCGLSANLTELIVYRGIQGIGSAGMQIMPVAILADIVPARSRPRYLGPLSSVFFVATIVGPVVGGTFTDTIGWRWIFWVNLPLGILAIVLAGTALNTGRVTVQGSFDFLGAGLLVVSASAILLITSLGGTLLAWSAPGTLALEGVVLVAATLFAWVELRSAAPLLPLSMFRNRTMIICTGLGLVVSAGLFSVVDFLPSYVQLVYGTSATEGGLILLALVIGFTGTVIVTGRLVSRSGNYKRYPVGGTLLAVVSALLFTRINELTPLWMLVALVILIGIGAGSFVQIVVVVAQNAQPPAIVSSVTSTMTFVRQLGLTAGIGVFGGLFASRLTMEIAAQSPSAFRRREDLTPAQIAQLPAHAQRVIATDYVHAFTPQFYVLAAIFAAGFLIALFLPSMPLGSDLASGIAARRREPPPAAGQNSGKRR